MLIHVSLNTKIGIIIWVSIEFDQPPRNLGIQVSPELFFYYFPSSELGLARSSVLLSFPWLHTRHHAAPHRTSGSFSSVLPSALFLLGSRATPLKRRLRALRKRAICRRCFLLRSLPWLLSLCTVAFQGGRASLFDDWSSLCRGKISQDPSPRFRLFPPCSFVRTFLRVVSRAGGAARLKARAREIQSPTRSPPRLPRGGREANFFAGTCFQERTAISYTRFEKICLWWSFSDSPYFSFPFFFLSSSPVISRFMATWILNRSV